MTPLLDPLIGTIGEVQCGLPILERIGPWLCLGETIDDIGDPPEDFIGDTWEPPASTESPDSAAVPEPEASSSPSSDPVVGETPESGTSPAPDETSTPTTSEVPAPDPAVSASESVATWSPAAGTHRLGESDFALAGYQGTSLLPMNKAQACLAATFSACWFYSDDYHASNWVHGNFGYDKKLLGKVKLDVMHALHGAGMVSRISFNSSTAIKYLRVDGNLLYGKSATVGTAVSGQSDYTSKSSLAAGAWWQPWKATAWGGYFSIDKTRYNHSNVIGVSWEKNGYPGYWYVYQKSIIADDENNNKVYGFNSAEDRFLTSSKGGYRAG